MKPPPGATIAGLGERRLWGVIMALAALYPLAYVAIALTRMGYPFELEWMEGGVVDHVRRILDGHPLYVEPTLGFTPFIYPPLYFYAAAFVSRLMGGVQLEERDVGVRLGGDDPRPHALAAQKLDGNRVGEMNDVRRRHHLPVLRDQHAGADLAELHELALVRDLLLACPDDHDRRTHVLEDLGQVLSGRGRQGRGDRSERHEQDHRAFHAHPPPLTLDGWS